MKKLFLLPILALACVSCQVLDKKSEEAIILKIDTKSLMEGRTIENKILIKNDQKLLDNESYLLVPKKEKK